MDKNLNNLLKWSIENTSKPQGATGVTAVDNSASNGAPTGTSSSDLTPELMAALFGGPSEAELMKAAIELINDPDESVTLDQRLTAFDNFEQLIESLDNANNLENLQLWAPLLDLLEHEERELRLMAAWCVGTAVQNNMKTQERLLARGGLPRLVHLATHDDEHETVRRKAIYALSSAVRNFQPAMDIATEELKKKGHHDDEKVDASDMEAVDRVIKGLKEKASKSKAAA